jgi:hypothetical protein
MGTRQLLTPAPFSLATRGITVDSDWSNVGIGTNSPLYRLHVRGTGFFTDGDAPYGLFETDGGSFGPQLRLKHNGPGGQDWVTVSAGSGNGPQGSLMFVRSGSSNVPLTLSPSDNVGIGTVTPANRLSVAGNADVTGNVGIGTTTPANRLSVAGNANVTGNVGIGTASPIARVEAVTSPSPLNDPVAIFRNETCGSPCGQEANTENVRLVNTAAAGSVGIGLMVEPGATINSVSDVWLGTGFGSGTDDNNFVIATKTSPTTLTNRLVVNGDSGNVGIGTDTPAARLHNVGTTRLDGALQFGADLQNGNTLRWSRFDGGPGSTLATLDISPVTVANSSAFAISRNGAQVFLFQLDGTAAKLGGGAWAVLSDERSKNDIQPMTGTLDRLLQLKGHAYTYKPEFVENGRALPGMQIGLVAQEVETVFPDWVTTGADGLKQVTERSTTALMVEALRDLRTEKDAEINDLKARLEKLEALLAAQVASQAK